MRTPDPMQRTRPAVTRLRLLHLEFHANAEGNLSLRVDLIQQAGEGDGFADMVQAADPGQHTSFH